MDTTKLAVGQDVYMLCCGDLFMRKGHVVNVTPEGVDVQTGVMQIGGTWNAHEVMHFDKDGKERDPEPYVQPEFGPWELSEGAKNRP